VIVGIALQLENSQSGVMTHSVVSAGDTRLFAGMGLGVGKARIFVIVVFIGALRLTMPASASVPVFYRPALNTALRLKIGREN